MFKKVENISTASFKDYYFSLGPEFNREKLSIDKKVQINSRVLMGQCLAKGKNVFLHSPVSGTVKELSDNLIVIENDYQNDTHKFQDGMSIYEMTREIGLVGMGGAMFPASLKYKDLSSIKSFVINCVECEPLVQIDKAILSEEFEVINSALSSIRRELNPERIYLAIKKPTITAI